MITAIILILILSVLVLAHEFGHFFVARKNDVRVEEFGWGLPPRAWGKKIGETLYSINWLPFGGFVKLTGEDFEEELENSTNKDSRSFAAKTPLQRALILVSGVVMNVLLAVFIYYVMFFVTGFKTMSLPLFFDHKFRFGNQETVNTVVMNFTEDSAAEKVGIEVGEAIIEIDGQPVYSVPDVRTSLEGKAEQEVQVLLMDIRGVDREFRSVRVVPQVDEEGDVLLGVALAPGFRLSYYSRLWSAPQHAYNIMSYSTRVLYLLAQESFSRGDISPISESVSGPVGIFGAVKNIVNYSGKGAVVGLLDLTALLSLSLALLNIMPFPALDGGRLVFVLYEMAKGKKPNPKIETMAHRWGMFALLALIIVITAKDVRNLM